MAHLTHGGNYTNGCRCDECRVGFQVKMKIYAKKRRTERGDALDKIKTNSGCIDCGYKDFAVALDFDHLPWRGEKKFNLSQCWNKSWAEVLAEIEKCEVVCANCHRIRTWARKVLSNDPPARSPESLAAFTKAALARAYGSLGT